MRCPAMTSHLVRKYSSDMPGRSVAQIVMQDDLANIRRRRIEYFSGEFVLGVRAWHVGCPLLLSVY